MECFLNQLAAWLTAIIAEIAFYQWNLQENGIAGADPGGGGGALGAEVPPFIFRLYLINMLSIIMKFCLSIII